MKTKIGKWLHQLRMIAEGVVNLNTDLQILFDLKNEEKLIKKNSIMLLWGNIYLCSHISLAFQKKRRVKMQWKHT